ncbi:MAG: VOC family protein [Actinomycetota bacterium]
MGGSGFSVSGLDHVTVTTPVELAEEVISWYSDCFGLERIDKLEGTRRDTGAWFKVGDVQLHVSQDEHNPPPAAHFALQVDDFEAAVERLREASCHLEQASPIPGRRRCFTRDPAGNLIEILSFDGGPDA